MLIIFLPILIETAKILNYFFTLFGQIPHFFSYINYYVIKITHYLTLQAGYILEYTHNLNFNLYLIKPSICLENSLNLILLFLKKFYYFLFYIILNILKIIG
jgi:hypothetical protein